MKCPIVSDVFLSSDGKLFHTDGPAAEKLRGPKPTVLVFGVARSPRSADRRCRRVAIAVTGVSSDVRSFGPNFSQLPTFRGDTFQNILV